MEFTPFQCEGCPTESMAALAFRIVKIRYKMPTYLKRVESFVIKRFNNEANVILERWGTTLYISMYTYIFILGL